MRALANSMRSAFDLFSNIKGRHSELDSSRRRLPSYTLDKLSRGCTQGNVLQFFVIATASGPKMPQLIHAFVSGCSRRVRYDLDGQYGGLQMPSSLVLVPTRSDEDSHAQQKREFDRWRTAIELVQRMREAGVECQLSDGFQTRQ
jgi:hypothetical protein